ncbi:MAG: hypothetical protein WAT79_08775 [Saprospiraceae bacterium]
MRTLSAEQEELLYKAYKSLSNMMKADIVVNESSCGSFHIKPFNKHWDETTVKEVMYGVKLYLGTWVASIIEEALDIKPGVSIPEKKVEEIPVEKEAKTELVFSPSFMYEQDNEESCIEERSIHVVFYNGSVDLVQGGQSVLILNDHVKKLFEEILHHLPAGKKYHESKK